MLRQALCTVLLLLSGLFFLSTPVSAQCEAVVCGDGTCDPLCGECTDCADCQAEDGQANCEAFNVENGDDAGLGEPGQPGGGLEGEDAGAGLEEEGLDAGGNLVPQDAGALNPAEDAGNGDPTPDVGAGNPPIGAVDTGSPANPNDGGNAPVGGNDGGVGGDAGNCETAVCGDGACDDGCGECDGCADCDTPLGRNVCQADVGEGDECDGTFCGDGACDDGCGECDGCADCDTPDGRNVCMPGGTFDFTDCVDGVYYERAGFPEVSEGGAACSTPDCPTFEEFCSDPANFGVGVTACTPANPCGGGMNGGPMGAGTPMPCDCGDGELECREGEAVEDECQNNCDCVGSESGGRCREDPLCGNTCDLKCANRRDQEFNSGAFSSCEFVCPTTRVPQAGNPGRVYYDQLPDFCKGGTDACENPDAPPIDGPLDQQLGSESCGFYLRLRHCLTDCGACEKNRLLGYSRICRNIRGLSNGPASPDFPGGNPALPAQYDGCWLSGPYNRYTDGMMFCLQAKASIQINDSCPSCSNVVNGLPNIDIESGIIGVHTECNSVNNFCDLATVPGGLPLKCFGASLGKAWGSILGGHSPIGSLQPVGICHLMSQLVACAQGGLGGAIDLANWQTQICEGYVDGCMTEEGLGDLFPNCNIPGIGNCRLFLRRQLCEATCPQLPQVGLLGILNLGEGGALAFESVCNTLLTTLLNPFGFPIIPGADSGRDPCLTY